LGASRIIVSVPSSGSVLLKPKLSELED